MSILQDEDLGQVAPPEKTRVRDLLVTVKFAPCVKHFQQTNHLEVRSDPRRRSGRHLLFAIDHKILRILVSVISFPSLISSLIRFNGKRYFSMYPQR